MNAEAEMSFEEVTRHLQSLAHDPTAAESYVRVYLTARAGHFPLIEGSTAHFLYQAEPGVTVGLAGDWNGFDATRSLMQPVGGGLLHYQHDFEPDARIDYLIVESELHAEQWPRSCEAIRESNVRVLRDPLNPHSGRSGWGDRSELRMPFYQRPVVSIPVSTTPNAGTY